MDNGSDGWEGTVGLEAGTSLPLEVGAGEGERETTLGTDVPGGGAPFTI